MASRKNQLKAFVRYDFYGKIVPGSLVVQASMPKVGTWREVPSSICCNESPIPANCIQFVVNTTFDTFFTFSAGSSTQEYTYTVTWGDGTSDSGSSGEGFIQPEHTYANPNTSYTATICFSDASIINNLNFPGFD